MKKPPFETTVNGETFYCLSNDWKEGEYRYSLELSRTETPENTILVVGVNPGGKTDPEVPFIGATVRRVCGFVARGGENDMPYDSMLFVNLTPVIAKRPSELRNNEKVKSFHEGNIKKISALINERGGRIRNVLFCFGGSFRYNRELFAEVVRAITEVLPPDRTGYWCLGLSSKGYPVHPLAHMSNLGLTEFTAGQIASILLKDRSKTALSTESEIM